MNPQHMTRRRLGGMRGTDAAIGQNARLARLAAVCDTRIGQPASMAGRAQRVTTGRQTAEYSQPVLGTMGT